MGSMLLRRATQIVNRIYRETAFEVPPEEDDYYGSRRKKKTVATLNALVSVNIDGNPVQRVTAMRLAFLAKSAKMFRLMNIATKLRTEMGLQQVECGVGALVTERVTVLRQQHIIETLLNSVGESVFEVKEFTERVIATKKRLETITQGTPTAEITTVLLTEDDVKILQTDLINLKRRMLDIDDRLAELNSTNSITISDEDEQYLRDIGIV